MEIKILKQDKSSIDIEVDNLTVVELLRSYLNNESGVKLAAWRREHPLKNPILHVEADNPKSVIKKAITAVEKDIDKNLDEFKKLK